MNRNFVEFLNPDNYIRKRMETFNLIDGEKVMVCTEGVNINTFYEKNIDDNSTYNLKLGLPHHNLMNEKHKGHFERSILRLRSVLESDKHKIYIYNYPIMGINDFYKNKQDIFIEFEEFQEFMSKQTNSIYGVFIMLVRNNNINPSEVLKDTANYIIYLINCNDKLIDGGGTFQGEFKVEESAIIEIFKKYI